MNENHVIAVTGVLHDIDKLRNAASLLTTTNAGSNKVPVSAFGVEMALIPLATVAMPQAMPSPLWQGVSRIALACSSDFDAALCTAIATATRDRTPLQVTVITDKAPIDRSIVVLTLARDDDGRQLVAVARRALEIDDAEGPARYAVAWNPAAPMDAVEDLLARILPHRSRRGRRLE